MQHRTKRKHHELYLVNEREMVTGKPDILTIERKLRVYPKRRILAWTEAEPSTRSPAYFHKIRLPSNTCSLKKKKKGKIVNKTIDKQTNNNK